MEHGSVEAIVRALNGASVRYLIVGGLAVVAHGHVRLTADVDIVLDPDPAALLRAISALSALGYRPRAPVPFEAFADSVQRKGWAREKGMTVFSTFSPAHPATEIDLFLEPPFDFEKAYARSRQMDLGTGPKAAFVGLADLFAMKRHSGRSQDLEDIANLIELHGEPTAGE